MNIANEVVRSLIRGLGYRAARGLPWWVAALMLAGFYIYGRL
ncbi:hypothetical protein EVC24_014 [Rhizobium phage RHph_I4]|nr:hypothetical protein EVC24_014 [Rhizobium phage RHph_I4]